MFLARPKVLSTTLDDGAVLLELQKGTYFGLNEVGRYVWGLLQTQNSIQVLEENVIREFDVSIVQARADLITFIRALLSNGLIQQIEKGVGSSSP